MSLGIFGKGHPENHTCCHSELKSLGVEANSKIKFPSSEGLGKLRKRLKYTIRRQHKLAYSDNREEEFLTSRNPLSEIGIEYILEE